MRPVIVGTLIVVASLVASATGDNEVEKIKNMRKEVLKDLFANEDRSSTVADAYSKLFTHVGLASLKKFMDDEDTSIALQAAWELHRKAVKRDPPITGRTDWVFDKKPMEQFLKLAGKRLKTEPPAWWGGTLLKGDVFPGEHHVFVDEEGPFPPPVKWKVEKDDEVLTSGKQSVSVRKVDFDKAAGDLRFGASPVILYGETLSFVAVASDRGYPFPLWCVDSKTGKKQWEITVWAARRGFSSGPPYVCPVEIRRHGDTVIVYGTAGHGMYAEGFDTKSGTCQFRFCTCYWFNFSEAWGLK